MTREGSKTKLSRHLLDMKFMQKSKEKAEKDAEAEEEQALFSSQITDKMKKSGIEYVFEESYVPCVGLLQGRMSFKGRNPEIERLMRENEINDPAYSKMGGITDEEMASRYSTLVGSMAKKFQKKRQRPEMTPSSKKDSQRPAKTRKFMKPSDDA
ncbi:M-phase phosphoprotein 6-like [Ornithodoros turicata]